jgi:hypothetical protein
MSCEQNVAGGLVYGRRRKTGKLPTNPNRGGPSGIKKWKMENVTSAKLSTTNSHTAWQLVIRFCICLGGHTPNSINYVKSSVLAHFAAGGSSNSVILDAHVVERENQFLAAEADDEAAEDLCLHATRSNAFLKAWKSTRL